MISVEQSPFGDDDTLTVWFYSGPEAGSALRMTPALRLPHEVTRGTEMCRVDGRVVWWWPRGTYGIEMTVAGLVGRWQP